MYYKLLKWVIGKHSVIANVTVNGGALCAEDGLVWRAIVNKGPKDTALRMLGKGGLVEGCLFRAAEPKRRGWLARLFGRKAKALPVEQIEVNVLENPYIRIVRKGHWWSSDAVR